MRKGGNCRPFSFRTRAFLGGSFWVPPEQPSDGGPEELAGRAPAVIEAVASLFRGRAARVVFDKRLRLWLLVDDYVPFRPPKHCFELFRLVARKKREAVILLANHLVLGHSHLDLLLAAGVAPFTRSALAEKFKDEVLALESRFGRPVELFDSLVHFPDERFVSRLPLKA